MSRNDSRGTGEPPRTLAVEELRRSEERFRLLVDSVRDYAIFMLDPTGHVATWNSGAERIKGYRAHEIIGQHFSVFYPNEKVAEGFPQYELEVAAREGRFEDEGWRIRKNGSRFWANVVITALRDESGRLIGYAKVTRDLTERRAAEEQSRRLAAEEAARVESERRNKELQQLSDQLQEQAIEIEQQKEEALAIAEQFEQAELRGQAALRRAVGLQRVSSALVGAVSETDVARIVVKYGCEAVGAAAGSFALLDGDVFHIIASEGYDPATAAQFRDFPLVPGRPVSDAVKNNSPLYQSSFRVLDTKYPYTTPVLQGTGLEAFVALPIRAGSRPVAALSFSFAEERAFDAEDRAFLETLAAQAGQALDRARLVEAERAARTEAETARSAAEEANRAKSEFLATMSHELRTPLNAIAGYAELLEMGLHGPVTEDQLESLQRIRRSQLHLTALINEVLNYARLESGMVTYEIRPVLIADVVAIAVPLVEPQRAAKGISLEIRLPELAGWPPLYVMADKEKLQQILLNLLSNALKFTPEGGRVEIGLSPTPNEDGLAVLRVSDTGIGIPEDKLEAIFEPFVQVGRSLRNPGEGTGLGLAISRDLARAMGGDITATSDLGSGAVFTVYLPAVRLDRAD